MNCVIELVDAEATEALGARLARCVAAGATIYLYGDLGAGKTTLVRGFLHALGHAGNVKSPTYTLVEPYETPSGPVFHFDLYRLADAEELEFMGIRDFFSPNARCLVEWPERGAGFLPRPDASVNLRPWNGGRQAMLESHTECGAAALGCLVGTG